MTVLLCSKSPDCGMGRTLRVVCDEVVREHMIDENAGRRRVRHSKFEQGKV